MNFGVKLEGINAACDGLRACAWRLGDLENLCLVCVGRLRILAIFGQILALYSVHVVSTTLGYSEGVMASYVCLGCRSLGCCYISVGAGWRGRACMCRKYHGGIVYGHAAAAHSDHCSHPASAWVCCFGVCATVLLDGGQHAAFV